jgi:GNAT superfamily N-acetyltransferase
MIPDRVEAALWAAFLRNRNVDAGTAGDGAIPVAGGYAIFVAGSLLDLALGAGTTRPLREDDLAVVEEFYGARAHGARFELDEANLERDGDVFRARGYAKEELTLAVLEGPTLTAAPPSPVAVRTTTNARGWTELATRAAADENADLETLKRTLAAAAAAATVLCVASLEGQDVGVGGIRIYNDLALLVSGAVLPAYRNRGVHGALFGARLAIAHARGATRAALKTIPDSAAERSARRFEFARTGLRKRVRRPAA